MSDRARFITAFVAGIPLAFLGLISGLIVIGAMLFAAILTLLTFGRVAFAGLAIALGGIWALDFVLAAWYCAGPGQLCGATPVDLAPHIFLSVGLVLLGVIAFFWGRLRAAARVEQDDGRLGGE